MLCLHRVPHGSVIRTKCCPIKFAECSFFFPELNQHLQSISPTSYRSKDACPSSSSNWISLFLCLCCCDFEKLCLPLRLQGLGQCFLPRRYICMSPSSTLGEEGSKEVSATVSSTEGKCFHWLSSDSTLILVMLVLKIKELGIKSPNQMSNYYSRISREIWFRSRGKISMKMCIKFISEFLSGVMIHLCPYPGLKVRFERCLCSLQPIDVPIARLFATRQSERDMHCILWWL